MNWVVWFHMMKESSSAVGTVLHKQGAQTVEPVWSRDQWSPKEGATVTLMAIQETERKKMWQLYQGLGKGKNCFLSRLGGREGDWCNLQKRGRTDESKAAEKLRRGGQGQLIVWVLGSLVFVLPVRLVLSQVLTVGWAYQLLLP
jgi:hypothetical protein